MADEALLQLVCHGREERNLEYKQSLGWNSAVTKAKVAKSAMAMANIPDGGVLVLGVRQEGEIFVPEGMAPEHVVSFAQDDVQAKVNEYADPYVELTVTRVTHSTKQFVVIQVRGFDYVPVVCKKAGEEGLRSGAVYSRSRRKYETMEVASQTEMREIIERAVDIQLRTLQRRGLISLPLGRPAQDADKTAFEQQLGGL